MSLLPSPNLASPLTLHVRSVTPILGGGTALRQVDSVDVIRAASLRGALRMWWRSLYGHRHATTKALYEAEKALFGGVNEGAPVCSQVRLHVRDVVRSQQDLSDIDLGHPAAYALFPARSERTSGAPPAPRWKPDVRFTLELTLPEEGRAAAEIRGAMRALLLFGGYGARTRRGCGSLALARDTKDIHDWLPKDATRAELRRLFGEDILIADGTPGEYPRLQGAEIYIGAPKPGGEAAWHDALSWLREFRQGAAKTRAQNADNAREAPSAPPMNRPGRSNWPEPDKVRQLFGRPGQVFPHAPRHNRTPAWPRAGFGLPILGQFQGKGRNRDPYRDREPPPFELGWQDKSGELHDRLASPLIVKAMPLSDGRFVPVALWLARAYPRGQVVLVEKDRQAGGKRARRGSEAPFDGPLVAAGDTALFRPLASPTLRQAFFSWIESSKGARRLP